jgi:hypothetical protein
METGRRLPPRFYLAAKGLRRPGGIPAAKPSGEGIRKEMMQKEGGAPSCILYTRSIWTVRNVVKNNLSIFMDMGKVCLKCIRKVIDTQFYSL